MLYQAHMSAEPTVSNLELHEYINSMVSEVVEISYVHIEAEHGEKKPEYAYQRRRMPEQNVEMK